MGPVLYQQLKTAFDWHMLPSTLGICEPEYDSDYMMAYSNTQAKMAAWEKHITEEERAKDKALKDAKNK